MISESSNVVQVSYLTFPLDSSDQVTSLANYLNAHGVEAFSDEGNGVTCPIFDAKIVGVLHQLQRCWLLFWEHSDAEVFGLSVYVKPACTTTPCDREPEDL